MKLKPHWQVYFLPLKPEAEIPFHPERKWRFDLAWKKERVAVEVDGGVWIGGRHTTGQGFVNDMEKLNNAALLGWRVFRFTVQQVKSGEAREFMLKVFA